MTVPHPRVVPVLAKPNPTSRMSARPEKQSSFVGNKVQGFGIRTWGSRLNLGTLNPKPGFMFGVWCLGVGGSTIDLSRCGDSCEPRLEERTAI